jgi:hypothetical protein
MAQTAPLAELCIDRGSCVPSAHWFDNEMSMLLLHQHTALPLARACPPSTWGASS